MDLNEKLGYVIEDTDAAIRRTKRNLRREAGSMIRNMERLVCTIDEDGTINELGEVQGRGLDVDRLCAKLGQLQETAAMLGFVVRVDE